MVFIIAYTKYFSLEYAKEVKVKLMISCIKKIGKDAGKIRFEVRRIKEGHVTSGMIERKCIK